MPGRAYCTASSEQLVIQQTRKATARPSNDSWPSPTYILNGAIRL